VLIRFLIFGGKSKGDGVPPSAIQLQCNYNNNKNFVVLLQSAQAQLQYKFFTIAASSLQVFCKL